MQDCCGGEKEELRWCSVCESELWWEGQHRWTHRMSFLLSWMMKEDCQGLGARLPNHSDEGCQRVVRLGGYLLHVEDCIDVVVVVLKRGRLLSCQLQLHWLPVPSVALTWVMGAVVRERVLVHVERWGR